MEKLYELTASGGQSTDSDSDRVNEQDDVEENDDDAVVPLIGTSHPTIYSRKWIKVFAYIAVGFSLISLIAAFAFLFYNQILTSLSKVDKNNEDIIHIYHLTDIHLDLNYNNSWPSATRCHFVDDTNLSVKLVQPAYYGRIGCDSPQLLFNNALLAVKVISLTAAQNVDFILATGDFVGHPSVIQPIGYDHDEDRVFIALNYTSQKFLNAFPLRPILPAIGNNDNIGNYILPDDHHRWYDKVFKLWSKLITCPLCPRHLRTTTAFDEIRRTFLHGGYYKVELYDRKLVILTLNTLYWDIRAIHTSNLPVDVWLAIANDQMAWLADQLAHASNNDQVVIIQGHIPPGIDPYLGSKTTFEHFWLSNYTKIYTQYVTGIYRNIIVGQFYGHLHRDDFRLLEDDDGNASFLLIAPAISPVYSNNPAFRVLMVNKTEWKLSDYIQYYLDLALTTAYNRTFWNEAYRFSTHYPSQNKYIDTARMQELNENLLSPTKAKYWLNYALARQVGYKIFSKMRFVYYCAIKYIRYGNFNACLQNYPYTV